MEESRLSMMQRKTIQNAVDRGESLPPNNKSRAEKKIGIEPQVHWNYIDNKISDRRRIKYN